VKKFTKEEIIRGFKSRDNRVVNSVYQEMYPKVESYISANSGNSDEASDIFQDAMLFLLEKANQLVIRENFQAFLISVCKYQWIGMIKEKKREESHLKEFTQFYYEDLEWEDEIQKKEILIEIVNEHLAKMKSKNCRETLRLFFNKVSYSKIVSILGIGSELYAKSLKYRCVKKLIQSVLNDPRLASLFS